MPAADLIKALLGSGGVIGLLLLVGRSWQNRPTVSVKLERETFGVKEEPNIEVRLSVEFENQGRENTSFSPEARVESLTADREPLTFDLSAEADSRTLHPVTPLVVAFKGRAPATYVFSHFRVVQFRFSRGPKRSLRTLNASGCSAGYLRFSALRLLFRVFGALPHVHG
ncbi:MAG: hypothetical protein H0W34_08550 [Pyrinomonadaceae bacterium]|nr:hypothetical protein [Pyrinomonadaceae bacterium]